MDAIGLHVNIDYLGTSGIILSPEQKAALQTSLAILQHENKFKKVYFWGKIMGVKDEYLIAKGVDQDEFGERKTFYSKDCMLWALLSPATEVRHAQSKLCKGRFTGDPSHEYEHVTKKVAEGDDPTEVEETTTTKEEDRLISMLAEVERDVWIVPRGAFTRSPTGEVWTNRHFEGLTVSEAAKLSNYMHFRQPVLLTQKSLMDRAHLNPAIDFMDPLNEDIPRGSWTLQFDRGSGLVILRSLQWIGYSFYYVPGTRCFGSAYFGNGEKNMDLPFML